MRLALRIIPKYDIEMNKMISRLEIIRKDSRNLWNMLLKLTTKWFCDEMYIRLKYRLWFGKSIDMNHPHTFNEKLNWLKLNYHNPMMTVMADKYWAKKWVAEKIGLKYIVPCYGHWKRFEDINFSKLPDVFFLKSNQDSGGGLKIDQRKGIDMKMLEKRFSSKAIAKKNWFWASREWAYKNIEPCILAEEYLDEGTGYELHDYKFWCFNGRPVYMYITNKGTVIKENFYDMDFNPVNINHGFERTVPEYKKPINFEEMKELAKVLSKGLPFVRIDFFNANDKLKFGECTFYDWSGFRPFKEYDWDVKLGNLLDIDCLYENSK